jgi:hypothetical protein
MTVVRVNSNINVSLRFYKGLTSVYLLLSLEYYWLGWLMVVVYVVVVGMVVWLVDACPYLTSAAVRKESVAPVE